MERKVQPAANAFARSTVDGLSGRAEGLVFPGDPGIPDTLAPTKHTNFAPRIGLAYSPSFSEGIGHKLFGNAVKTVIRAGYGMYYTAFEGLSAGIMSANPPYGYDYTSLAPPTFVNPFMNATGQTIAQPFPVEIQAHGASVSNPKSSVDWSGDLPVTGVPSTMATFPPYTESYTFSIQREIAKNTVLSASYIGANLTIDWF